LSLPLRHCPVFCARLPPLRLSKDPSDQLFLGGRRKKRKEEESMRKGGKGMNYTTEKRREGNIYGRITKIKMKIKIHRKLE
jgi:hypothetical protein